MKEFFIALKRSINDPAYYRELLEKPFSYSVRYFYTLAMTLAFVGTVYLLIAFVPLLSSFLRDAGPKLVNYYPANLTITIKDHRASVNQPEPYAIPMPAELKTRWGEYASSPEAKSGAGVPDALLVTDTSKQFSAAAFAATSTALYLFRDGYALRADDGSPEFASLSPVPDIAVTRGFLRSGLDAFVPLLKFILPIGAVLLFFGFLVGASFLWGYLALAALLVMLVARMKKKDIGYKKAYQLGFHLLTPGAIIVFLMTFALPGFRVPFLFTLVFIIAAVRNLKAGETQPEKKA